MMSLAWPPRGQNRGQRKQQQSDIISNENSESMESGEQQTSLNPPQESKSEQSMNSDETTSPINDNNDDENMNSDDKQDRSNRSRINRTNQQQIENRGRRYYDGNMNNNNNNLNNNNNTNNNNNPNNNLNNRRTNDRDRSSWQDRNNSGNPGPNSNTNNNQRFRSDTGSSTNHGPPLCKFFVDNRCMKVCLANFQNRIIYFLLKIYLLRVTIVYSVMILNLQKKWKYANIMFKIKVIVKKMNYVHIYMENFHVNSFIPVQKIVCKVIDVNFHMIQLQMKILLLLLNAYVFIYILFN